MSLPTEIEDAIHGVIESRPEARCLLLYSSGTALGEVLANQADCLVALDDASDSRSLPLADAPYDLAIVIDAPAALGVARTRQLLARLRNVDARAVLAVFARQATSAAWQRSDFLALGFRQLSGARELSADYWLYRYDIHDYKLTPDWLSPRHWANPGQWDKRRW